MPEEVGHVRSANKINLLNCIVWMPAVSTCVFQDGEVGNLVHYIVPSFPVIPSYFAREGWRLTRVLRVARDCDLLNHPMSA